METTTKSKKTKVSGGDTKGNGGLGFIVPLCDARSGAIASWRRKVATGNIEKREIPTRLACNNYI